MQFVRKKGLLLSAVALMFVLSNCNCPFCCKKDAAKQEEAPKTEQAVTKALTAESFDEATKSEKLTVIKFWAPWCGACTESAPAYDKVATELKETVNFCNVNIDEQKALAEKYDVKGVPAFLFFKDGKKLDMISGALSEEKLKEEITKANAQEKKEDK